MSGDDWTEILDAQPKSIEETIRMLDEAKERLCKVLGLRCTKDACTRALLDRAGAEITSLREQVDRERGEVVRLRQEMQVRRHAHNALVCGLWQRSAITEGEAARLLGVDRVTARQMSEDLCLPWYGEPAGPLAPLYVEPMEAAEAS